MRRNYGSVPLQVTTTCSGTYAEQVETYMRRKSAIPIRLVVTESDGDWYHCEIGAISGDLPHGFRRPESIFRFLPRRLASADQFNVVHLVPTGIGAEIGGHAGDATPTAKLLASVCDTLITHPNVVNASDVFDIPRKRALRGRQRYLPTAYGHPRSPSDTLKQSPRAHGCARCTSLQQCSS